MKKRSVLRLLLIVPVILLGACLPITFSKPTQIHISPADQVTHPVIAMDAQGRAHIAGVVDDRIIYYRTYHGNPLAALAMTMTGSGANWKQDDPDIAVTVTGTAYLTWVEQHGGAEKFACWRSVPLIPPVAGYKTSCVPLDGTNQTTGNVKVAARGEIVYAVYDRIYTNGRIDSLWYKELTGTATTGMVYWYTNFFESGYLHSFDLGIDSQGKLHVAFLDNDGLGSAPYTNRLMYRSNVTTQVDGTMTQAWMAAFSNSLETSTDVSLSFYYSGSTERVAFADVYETSELDDIWIYSCAADGCGTHAGNLVQLPASWDAQSVIKDVNIVGINTTLHLSFIGDDDPSAAEQVYFKDGLAAAAPLELSDGTAAFKYDLEMTRVDPRPESPATVPVPVMAWAESNLVTIQYYVHDSITRTKVHDTGCLTSVPEGEIAASGIFLAGVWDACSNSWFAAQANLTHLPLAVK
jgi:hypothetical protein